MDKQSLITFNNPKSPISEAYRVLRTNIQFSSIDKPLKLLTITSSGPGEGKTTTAINIAITFVQAGNRVLVIDGDLRKPKVHKLMGLEIRNGLTNIITCKEDYTNFVKKSEIEGLDIITCGAIPPNPSELLASNQMKKLVEKLRQDYDLVIIDAPPIGSVTDAAIISTYVDGTILVAASGTVERESLQRSKELLQKVNANIIGVVINKLDKDSNGNSYYYYYYGDDDTSSKSKRKKTKASR